MKVFIVNSVSGNGKGKKVWPLLKRRLDERHVTHEVVFTEYPGHATELAREAASRDEVEAVIAVGGDGTVHEVGNGLIGTSTPLGYIPAGSGNDFARAMQVPMDPEQALRRVLEHRPVQVDMARFGERFLVSTAGIGFDGRVAQVVNESPWKKWMGRLTYVLGVLQVLRQYRPGRVKLVVDDEVQELDGVWFIAIANIPFYGGGMKICPDASNQDGVLDVCLVHRISRSMFLAMFPRVFKGTHVRHSAVKLFRGRRISITSEYPLVIHADGEIVGETPVELTVEPNALQVL